MKRARSNPLETREMPWGSSRTRFFRIFYRPDAPITLLDAPVQDMVNAVTQWGAGASIIYDPERKAP